MVFGKTFDEFIESVEKLFKGCIEKSIRLNTEKGQLLRTVVEYCGRRIDEKGWRFPKHYFDKVLDIPKPVYYHEIAQAMYIVNWLSTTIPNLAELRKPFSKYYNLKGKKLRVLKRQKKLVEWTPLLEKNWNDLISCLAISAKTNLSHYDRKGKIGLFTDASESTWSLIVGQCKLDNHLPFSTSNCQFWPMIFLSGTFTEGQQLWTVAEKEMFPVVKAFERVKFLLEGHQGEIHLFTDHKNLIPILRPEWTEKNSYLSRLRRWSLTFQHLKIISHHVSSYANSFADMFTRWAKGEKEMKVEVKAFRIGRINAPRVRHILNKKNLSEKSMKLIRQIRDSRISFIHPYYNQENKGKWDPPSFKSIQSSQMKWFKMLKQKTQTNAGIYSNLAGLLETGGKVILPYDICGRMLFWIHVSNGHGSLTSDLE